MQLGGTYSREACSFVSEVISPGLWSAGPIPQESKESASQGRMLGRRGILQTSAISCPCVRGLAAREGGAVSRATASGARQEERAIWFQDLCVGAYAPSSAGQGLPARGCSQPEGRVENGAARWGSQIGLVGQSLAPLPYWCLA